MFNCGELCQRGSWLSHKIVREEEFRMVNIRKWENQTLNTRPNHNALTKGHCIVQVNFIGVGDQQKIRNKELKVWSQEYTINAFLARGKGQEEVYDKLKEGY